MNALTAACPKCNPLYPELDEDGKPFTCYACCDTGVVSKAYADAYLLAEADAVEYKWLRPVVGGKHVVLRCDEYESWEERQPLLPRSVFPKPARDNRTLAEVIAADAAFEDIPF